MTDLLPFFPSHPFRLKAGPRLLGCDWSQRNSEVSLMADPEEDTLALEAWSRYAPYLEPGTGIFRVALYGFFGRIEGATQGIVGQ